MIAATPDENMVAPTPHDNIVPATTQSHFRNSHPHLIICTSENQITIEEQRVIRQVKPTPIQSYKAVISA